MSIPRPAIKPETRVVMGGACACMSHACDAHFAAAGCCRLGQESCKFIDLSCSVIYNCHCPAGLCMNK